MDLTPTIPIDRQYIEAYGEGGFRVSGERWHGSVLVFREATIAWPVTAFTNLTFKDLRPLVDANKGIEVLLMGCGPQIEFVDQELRAQLRDSGIVIEPMNTGAACRTFNVLIGEDRKVAAALIAIE